MISITLGHSSAEPLYPPEMQTPAQEADPIAVQEAMMAQPSFPEPFVSRAALDRLAESA
jgi:hypothetical protein